MSAKALTKPIDVAACREFLKGECSYLTNGYCETRACYVRGGWEPGSMPINFKATCEARQLSELLDRSEPSQERQP